MGCVYLRIEQNAESVLTLWLNGHCFGVSTAPVHHSISSASIQVSLPKLELAITQHHINASNVVLTLRQVEVLALVRVGNSNKQISNTLGISTNTVKAHLGELFKKYQVNNRTTLIHKAIGSIENAAI